MIALRYLTPLFVWLRPNGVVRTPAKTGRDTLFVCFDEETLGEHPKAVYVDGTRVGDPSPESHDEGKQKRLWEGSLRVARIKEGDTVLRNWK